MSEKNLRWVASDVAAGQSLNGRARRWDGRRFRGHGAGRRRTPWARIAGGTLTVNLPSIAENGDCVVQDLRPDANPGDMRLNFMRIDNGQIQRRIRAAVKSVGDSARALAGC